MEITLDEKSIDALARRIVELQGKKVDEEFVTAKEAAEILRISPDRVRRLKNHFKHTKVNGNGRILFLKSDIIKYAKS